MNEDMRGQDSEEHWISISDMMSVLMAIFLMISVSYMHVVTQDKARLKEIAEDAQRLQEELFKDLNLEFPEEELRNWGAEIIERPLTVRFDTPDVFFETGQAEVRQKFKNILHDFFPRYLSVLRGPKYRNDTDEIRIEGHTSSMWEAAVSVDDAYLLNMELSQGRARSVLGHVLSLPQIQTTERWRIWYRQHEIAKGLISLEPVAGPVVQEASFPDVAQRPQPADQSPEGTTDVRRWLKERLTANGLSSSKLRYHDGDEREEDVQASQRVEFQVRMNLEEVVAQIAATGGEL